MGINLLANGWLPGRGSVMLDVVFVAMMLVMPVQAFSLYVVKYRRDYSLHRTIQITTAGVLFLAIVAFEIDLQLFTDWRELAEPSPYYSSGMVDRFLWAHLLFAIPTPFIWLGVIVHALRRFGQQPTPGFASSRHKIWGWIALIALAMTSITGWIFYVVAFVM